jgi:hypothetical protein
MEDVRLGVGGEEQFVEKTKVIPLKADEAISNISAIKRLMA